MNFKISQNQNDRYMQSLDLDRCLGVKPSFRASILEAGSSLDRHTNRDVRTVNGTHICSPCSLYKNREDSRLNILKSEDFTI